MLQHQALHCRIVCLPNKTSGCARHIIRGQFRCNRFANESHCMLLFFFLAAVFISLLFILRRCRGFINSTVCRISLSINTTVCSLLGVWLCLLHALQRFTCLSSSMWSQINITLSSNFEANVQEVKIDITFNYKHVNPRHLIVSGFSPTH